MQDITPKALQKLKQIESGMNESFIVDVSNPKKMKANYEAFVISDGQNKFKGIIQTKIPALKIEQIMKKKKLNLVRIKIISHITHYQDHQPFCIEIVEFELAQGKKKKQMIKPKVNSTKGNKQEILKTIQQLSDQLQYQNANTTKVSTIQGWIKQVGFDQKWFYDACPNPRCKKACSNNKRCQYCLFELNQCSKRYILQVQFVDFTGSIWITAFDQSANILLKQTSMESLFPMSNKQLMVYAESMFCYEHYRMQITSKIDHFGRMKHIINGKPIKLNLRESIKSNLALIETLGNELGVLMK